MAGSAQDGSQWTTVRTRGRQRLCAAVAMATLLAVVGCATPVGVEKVDAKTLRRELAANAVTTGTPSIATLRFLSRLAMDGGFEREPVARLAELHQGLGGIDQSDRLLALAELSFLHADESGDRAYYRAAALYAYAYLYSDDPSSESAPYGHGPRLARGLYNRALALGLKDRKDDTIDLSSRTLSLPFGSLTLETDERDLEWGGHRLEDFFSTDEIRVRGLRNRYRREGIGAPLGASAVPLEEAPDSTLLVPPRFRVPVTAFLRPEAIGEALLGGEVHARLEVYTFDRAETVRIGKRKVPLEFDSTATLAQGLETSTLWSFELAGFLGRILPLPQRDSGLFLLHPYHPGRVPVVLVHGTGSSPARWAELVNELQGDPDLGPRVQIWLFIYNTGNPILYSGHLLRGALEEAVATFDPEGRDPALSRMVVIGHSQGGLLAKLQVTVSGDRFWANASDEPFDATRMKPDTRAFLKPIMFFDPLPQVRSVVYIATPHRGSSPGPRWLADLAARLITLPAELVQRTLEVVLSNPDTEAQRRLERTPTALDNMSPNDPFTTTLSSLVETTGVAVHSIIAVKKPGPPQGQSDGLVTYESAHLDHAASELVVRSGHSTQANPFTIAEVKRILRLHLEGSE